MVEPISDKHERNSAIRLKSLDQLAGFNQSEPDYNFIGWHRDRFAIKQEYVPNQVVQFDRDTTLYGKWQRKNCTLLFNPCGGIIEDNHDGTAGALEIKIVVERGKTITDIPVTTKDGYIFLGWYTDPDAGTIVTEDTIITDDAMLFARWQIDYDRFLQEIQGDIAAAIDDIDISIALDDEEGEGGEEAQPKVELGPLMPPIPEGSPYGHYQRGADVDGKTTLVINTDEGEKPVPVDYANATFTLTPNCTGSLRTAWWAADNGGQLAGHERPPHQALRHKTWDKGRWEYVACKRYGEDQDFQSAVWEGEYNGEHKRFIYYRVYLQPAMDMRNISSESGYIYPEQPVYQGTGLILVRWFLMDSLGANKERLAISRETHTGASYQYANPKPGFSDIKIGTVILGATSFPNTFPYTTDPNYFDNPSGVNVRPEVWINANRATTIAGTYTKIGFNFWGDRYPFA